MTGYLSGSADMQECTIDGVQGLQGNHYRCGLTGTMQASADTNLVFFECYSKVPGTSSPELDMLSGSPASCNIRSYSGGIKVLNFDDASSNMTIEVLAGNITLDSTCTAGTIAVRGTTGLLDNSTGTTVNTDGLVNRSLIDTVGRQVEMLRSTHKGLGKTVYWSPVSGSDANNGELYFYPVKSFERALEIVDAGGNDIILALDDTINGTTYYTGSLTINKAGVRLRGPGNSFVINPTGSFDAAISVQADRVSIESIAINGAKMTGSEAAFTGHGISMKGYDYLYVNNVDITYPAVDGIAISGSQHVEINKARVGYAGEHGIEIYPGCYDTVIRDSHLVYNTEDGIFVSGSNITFTNIIGDETIMYNNGRYGVNIASNVQSSTIDTSITTNANGSGSINDLADDTNYTGQFNFQAYGGQIDYHPSDSNSDSGSNYPRGTTLKPSNNLTDTLAISTLTGIDNIYMNGSATATTSHNLDGKKIEGQTAGQHVFTLAGASTNATEFRQITVVGAQNGICFMEQAIPGNLTNFTGTMHQCVI